VVASKERHHAPVIVELARDVGLADLDLILTSVRDPHFDRGLADAVGEPPGRAGAYDVDLYGAVSCRLIGNGASACFERGR
jgi:hypothetical protein